VIALVVALVVAQPVTTTRVGTKVGQDTYCLNCAGGGGGTGGTVVQGVGIDGGQAWNVNGDVTARQGLARDGGVDWPTQAKVWDGVDSLDVTAAGAAKVDGSGVTQPVSAASLPLPTGASTSALQTTGNSSLSSIDGKTPALGQATMANSEPVVIASNQSAVPISGTVTANAGSGPWPVTDNGGSLTVDGTVATTQSGTWSVRLTDGVDTADVTAASRLAVDGSGVTQPISNANLDAALSTLLSSGTFTARINTQGQKAMSASTPVVIASDQSAVPASQSGTWSVTATQATGSNLHVVVDTAPTTTVTGTVSTTATGVASATTSASATTVGLSSTTVLASQAGRKDYTIQAASTNTASCYIRRGATATTSDIELVPGASFTDDGVNVYTGAVDAICGAAAQSIRATSL